jgi:hypothetical protein
VNAADIAARLGNSVHALVTDLLPGGHREGHEWRCGSVRGETGYSLGVHLVGTKAGVWADFSSGERGDALDLVKAVLHLDTPAALAWSRRWLGLEDGYAELPPRAPPQPENPETVELDPDRWRRPWRNARPIGGTLAERYLRARGLAFDDPEGDVLRFAARRGRKNPAGDFETHPAMLALLRDFVDGRPCGLINIFLRPDGSDRIRDRKGKTVTGRALGAVVMLDDFAEVTMGLTVCEGVETGVAIRQSGWRPVWCAGAAGSNLASLPVLAGIEALTIAGDADKPGERAAGKLAERWRAAGREVRIMLPPIGDWADHQ